MKLKKILASILCVAIVLSTMSFTVFAAETAAVAKVGNTEYATIDEAIANWTNGTTLTLLADVTLSDVIMLSSTEYHVLDLGTYTMTAASGKDAIQYVVNGRSSASYALDIKADATNPGGITATGKAIVSHIKPSSDAPTKDRPITRFYGGVFNASYVVKQGATSNWGFLTSGYTGASAPYFQFYGGEYNGTIYTNRSQNQFYGGTFNGSMQMSVDSSAYTLVAGGTFKNLSNSMGSTLNSDKFVIGTAKGANNGSVCIDENGYYVISTTTPAEAEASVASNYNSNNYFYYSTVNTNGMYYEDVYDALEANTTGTVTVFTDELDLTDSSFAGTIVVPEGETITIIVEEGTTPVWTIDDSTEATVTYTDSEGNELVTGDDGSFAPADSDVGITVDGIDIDITPVEGEDNSYEITLAEGASWTEGTSVTMTFPAVEGASNGDSAYIVHEHEDGTYIYVGKVVDGSVTITNTAGFSTFTVYEGGLTEALTAAQSMTGDVTVEIYDKVTLNQSLAGNYDSIEFVGKADVAEIYLDVQGYITATGKTVAFEDLKLSKSAGGFITNAGFMNVAFGVYDVPSVSYINCTFLNGAYASSGENTFTGCTFYRSYDKYGLWAYGNVDCTVDGCTFADYRGIKMYAEGAAKTTDLTVNNTNFAAVTDKPAIVLTYGESVTLANNTYSSTGVFELDLDGAPNGTLVTSDVSVTCKNDNGACGVLVDGKIYTTVAQAADVATEGSTVTLLHNSTETVEFAEGVILDKNNYTADGVTVKEAAPVAKIGDTTYTTLTEAAAAAQAGDEIVVLADVTEDVTVPAGVIFNGNGKQVGAITAAGEITFKGHTKATSFGTQYTNTTINIGVGACLEITGTGRLVIGHGCTFNIEGNIVDAKTANVAELTPSLIMPGASFTGAGVTFNVNNAYIKTTAYCSSKNSNASGTFDFNIENSIWDQTGSLVFSEPTNGKDPTVNFNLKDSVLNSTSHLVFAVTKGEIVIDNSNVNAIEGVWRQLENRSNMTIKNGSVVYASVATSSNAKNPGTTIVDNSTYKTTGEFSGSDLGTGTLIVKNGAKFSTGKITKANITIDAAGLIAGEIDMVDADLSSFAGELSVINNTLGAKIENGKIVLVTVPVAKIGDVEYTSLQEALDAAAAGTGNVTVDIISDIDLTGVDWKPVTVSAPGYPVVTVNGNDKTITGLNDMLFAGTWAGGSGLIINDLTIKDSAIVNDKDDTKGTVGVGAFIGFPQASATVTLNNCNLVDSSVEGGHWTGGLIGYAAGYAGNDGPVFMNLTINNCSVTGSTITGKGSAGGIIGHATGNAWTQVTITNTTVSDNAITSTGSSTNKAGAVMGTIGAAGQETTVNGETKTGGVSVSATVSDNTVTSNGTAITTIYGRQGTETGNLVVSGGTYEHYPIEENVSYANPADGYEIVENTDGTYGVAEAPSGTLSCAYTSATGYWGECGGNAKESFEFKFYNDNTYMGYTSLNNVGGIIDGSVYVSWSIKLDAASNTDPYWTMEWEVAPTIAMQPNRVEQWVDGVKVAECAVQPNWSDNIFPVVAAVTDADGKILSYVNNHEDATLANALANGETVTVLENIDLGGTTVTIPAGVDAILDLNGKTISDVCNVGQGHMIMVTYGANLTIKDSSTEKEGKITYASGTSNVGWVIDVEGNLVLESGTIELTGSWSIGYSVDVRPNAWGTAYTEPTTFVMNGGNIVSSDGAVRVASSSSETYPDVAASFTMNDGKIDAAWDGIFVQQSNAAWDTLSLTINGGTIESDLNPVRFYGPAATSYVNSEDCVDIKLNGGTLTYTGTEEQTWMVEGILRIGGGVTAEDFMKDATVTASASFAQSNVAEGYKWVESNDVYTLEKAEETANPFKDAPLFLAGLPDETVDGVTYHPVYMATSIDSLNYRKVGFDYIFQIFDPETGETTFEAPYTTETSEVYNSISDANTTYTVDSIGGNGEYLFMNKLLFDSEYYHNDNTKITITPYAIDMNGNKITGWTIDMTNEYYKELQSSAVKQDMFKEAN